jgi:hypothetical protein
MKLRTLYFQYNIELALIGNVRQTKLYEYSSLSYYSNLPKKLDLEIQQGILSIYMSLTPCYVGVVL